MNPLLPSARDKTGEAERYLAAEDRQARGETARDATPQPEPEPEPSPGPERESWGRARGSDNAHSKRSGGRKRWKHALTLS